jgi:aryl-alcohol dehydrogenase-like predicted oxidoreductase
MSRFTRRDFLKTTAATTAAVGTISSAPAWAQKQSATDWVTLGNSGVKVTRLAFGTGTFSGRVQRELGQEGFNRLVRHAYDRGIRFFETAEAYRGMPEMLGIALKGIPRDSYRLMTKYAMRGDNVPERLDSFRSALQTDYIDIVLMHCLQRSDWREGTKAVQDGLSEAKVKKVIMAHGASVHGIPALDGFPGYKWLDIALLRMNHAGARMDSSDMRAADAGPNDVSHVAAQAQKIRAQGTGLLGMKMIGEGTFNKREDRQAALGFAFKKAGAYAVTIGFKSPAEVDEAIENIERTLNA